MPAGERIYHLVLLAELQRVRSQTDYRPARMAADGFVHCATREVVLAVADDYFGDAKGALVLMELDPDRLTSEVRYEAAAPIEGGGRDHLRLTQVFPHVYGPLNLDAVVGVAVLPRHDNRYAWPTAWTSLPALLAGL